MLHQTRQSIQDQFCPQALSQIQEFAVSDIRSYHGPALLAKRSKRLTPKVGTNFMNTAFNQEFATSPIPEARAVGSKATRRGGSLIGMTLLCLVAIAGQSIGLFSLIRFGAEREGWNAQKVQFANVQSEWEKLSSSATSKVSELDQKKNSLMAEISKLEDDRSRLADDVAKVKGQFESLSQSREEALALQRRAQQQQQAALDAETAAQTRVTELTKSKGSLEGDIEQLKTERDGIQSAVQTAQLTSEQQKAAIAKQAQELTDMDKRLSSGREELRKQNAEMLKASDDLAKALAGKQAALATTIAAADEKERVSKLQEELATLTGKVAALKSEKETTQSDLAKEETRLQNAKLKLADFLEQWKTRETVLKDLTKIQADLTTLNAAKTSAEGELQRLKEQLAKSELDAATKSKERTELQSRIDELRKEEAKLAAALLERIKSLKAGDAKEGSSP